jgi:hypothetical protein
MRTKRHDRREQQRIFKPHASLQAALEYIHLSDCRQPISERMKDLVETGPTTPVCGVVATRVTYLGMTGARMRHCGKNE